MVRLLEQKAVINLKNKAGESPLTLAIKSRNEAIIQIIMERAKPGLKNKAGEAPLMLALEQSDLPLALQLIRQSADVNRKSNGITPVARATENGHTDLSDILAQAGAKPEVRNYEGFAATDHRNFDRLTDPAIVDSVMELTEDQ